MLRRRWWWRQHRWRRWVELCVTAHVWIDNGRNRSRPRHEASRQLDEPHDRRCRCYRSHLDRHGRNMGSVGYENMAMAIFNQRNCIQRCDWRDVVDVLADSSWVLQACRDPFQHLRHCVGNVILTTSSRACDHRLHTHGRSVHPLQAIQLLRRRPDVQRT